MNLIQIWKNKGQIIEGIKNNIFKKEHIEDIASERRQICDGCTFLDTSGDKCAVIGTQPCCGSCGCSLHFKLRSLSSSCPEGKWNEVTSEEEEELIKQKINENIL